ncbi:hypothetical protein MMC24_007843, partial [Lignoscripta atroalba]|nr:hypothetical protein [Lignoscripta atroalba]
MRLLSISFLLLPALVRSEFPSGWIAITTILPTETPILVEPSPQPSSALRALPTQTSLPPADPIVLDFPPPPPFTSLPSPQTNSNLKVEPNLELRDPQRPDPAPAAPPAAVVPPVAGAAPAPQPAAPVPPVAGAPQPAPPAAPVPPPAVAPQPAPPAAPVPPVVGVGGGLGPAAAQPPSISPGQISPVTTVWIGSVQVVFTQTFASVPSQGPSPAVGSIGMGTLTGTVGAVKTVAGSSDARDRGVLAGRG